MNAMEARNAFLQAAGKKINAARKDLMATGVRNIDGFNVTAERILKSADNLYLTFSDGSGKFNDPVKAIYKGFSERPALGNVNNVAGIDVVDINIEATNQSILGYLSAERGLEQPSTKLWMGGLAAIRDATGGYKEGNWVNSQFRVMNKAIRNAVKGALQVATADEVGGKVFTLPAESLTDTITVTKKVDGETVTVGRVVDGNIYFNDGTKATLEGKVLTFDAAPTGLTVNYSLDRSQERDGAHTIALKPKTETVDITAQPRRIHLEQSYED